MIIVSPNRAQHFVPLPKVVLLNFASGRRPGGGWRNHGKGQEESLCRDSTLGHLLEDHHKFDSSFWDSPAPFYTNQILEHTPLFFYQYQPTVLSMAQVNASKGLTEEILEAARQKINILLEYCSKNHSDKTLVFGPWGCGVFCLPPQFMAQAWKDFIPKYNFTEDIVFACGGKYSTYDVFRNTLKES